jgi:1-deoxyxylulose-5-phosphate synthase
MSPMNRREFIRFSAAGVLAAGMTDHAWGEELPRVAATPRTLGATGLSCSRLGIGTGTRAWNGSSEQNRQGREAFVELLEHAYAQGVTYYDMADMYGAHEYVKEAMTRSVDRDKVLLLTKTVSREPELVRADLERFRRELDTDVLDVVLFHCLTEPEWTERDAMKACMEVLADAKAKGQVKAHGVSCHNFGAMEAAAEHPWVDVMLARINPFGKEMKMDGTPAEVVKVLQTAHGNHKGVLGMKILGEGQAVDRMAESLEFVLGLACVDAMTIGFLQPWEVDDTIAKMQAAGVKAGVGR